MIVWAIKRIEYGSRYLDLSNYSIDLTRFFTSHKNAQSWINQSEDRKSSMQPVKIEIKEVGE